MNYVELTVIEEAFQISGRGVVIVPDFSVPKGGWKNQDALAIIERPDGMRFETKMEILLTHFDFESSNVPIDHRWRISICFPNRRQEEFPQGCKILVPQELRDLLLAG